MRHPWAAAIARPVLYRRQESGARSRQEAGVSYLFHDLPQRRKPVAKERRCTVDSSLHAGMMMVSFNGRSEANQHSKPRSDRLDVRIAIASGEPAVR